MVRDMKTNSRTEKGFRAQVEALTRETPNELKANTTPDNLDILPRVTEGVISGWVKRDERD
jgi:hypothetical protein